MNVIGHNSCVGTEAMYVWRLFSSYDKKGSRKKCLCL